MSYTVADYLKEEALRHRDTLTPAERLRGLTPAERLRGLTLAERLIGLTPAERLEGLDPEEIEAYLRKIRSRPQ